MLRSVTAGCLGRHNAAACSHLWALAAAHHRHQAADVVWRTLAATYRWRTIEQGRHGAAPEGVPAPLLAVLDPILQEWGLERNAPADGQARWMDDAGAVVYD
eukprot:8642322-Alexandrium_andersonii.AAC.1